MAWSVVCDSALEIRAESHFHFALVDEVVYKASGELYMVTYVVGVDVKYVVIFVAHGKRACRAGCKHFQPFGHRLAYRLEVYVGVAPCRIHKVVGYFGHTAAFLLVEQVYTVADSVHHRHEVFAELRIVVVDIASVEVAHLVGVAALLGSMALEP